MSDHELTPIDPRVEDIILEIVNGNAEPIPAFTIAELDVLQVAMNLMMSTNSEMIDGTKQQLLETIHLKIKTALNALHAKQIMADGLREFHRELENGTQNSDHLEGTARVVSRIFRDRIKRNGSFL